MKPFIITSSLWLMYAIWLRALERAEMVKSPDGHHRKYLACLHEDVLHGFLSAEETVTH